MKSNSMESTNQPISRLKGIMGSKCPHCRTGNMFPHSAFHPVKFHKTNSECPHCDFHFEVEPGFWTGAMYVSYGINTAVLLIGVLIVMMLFPEWSGWLQLGVVIVPLLLIFPFNFRISRVLYLYFFGSVTFDPKAGLNGNS